MALLRSVLVGRALLRTLPTNPSSSTMLQHPALRSRLCTAARRPIISSTPVCSPVLSRVVRHQSGGGDRKPVDQIDKAAEEKYAHQKLERHPEIVSTTSSTHPLTSEIAAGGEPRDEPGMAGPIMSDVRTIRETFNMQDVPRQAFYMGMAGVLPYLATSLSTVACAYEIKHAGEFGTGVFMSEKTAELALHIIEPLQIGYGAVIISFLGAIHWGLEWAGYGGYHGYRRYAIGVVSTACAWPTILLPPIYALISQFLVFNFLYYTDSRAARRGWAPAWYGVYRFVLTFIVGSSIVVSLIGRGQIAGEIGNSPSPVDRIHAFRDRAMDEEGSEEARKKYLGDEGEGEEEEEE
ncbi:hypothetical protein M433DRAFT_132157 [Acidomyces richmondensis BFW]|nr:MAG: hypothetical protein FE78DRAFT_137431 [Acidomyces sp. 'richmondensis']KYG48397.1 hypothetical protein M433DRAFT_132157 [Acidomyces richmondensis BFW]